jgi:hypothetical protein
MTTAENLLLENLQKKDREIAEAERALEHLNKQVGAKISKLKDLKIERDKLSTAYRELSKQ